MRMACAVFALAVGVGSSPLFAATIRPVSGSTSDPVGYGSIENVIDGVVDVNSWLGMGPIATSSPFAGPYTVAFQLGGVFNLTALNLWNNAGSIALDGEGIDAFTLNFRSASGASVGTFSGNAADILQQQSFSFPASNVARVDLVIHSNHDPSFRAYAAFHELNFEGSQAREPIPVLGTSGIVVFVLFLIGSALIVLRRVHLL